MKLKRPFERRSNQATPNPDICQYPCAMVTKPRAGGLSYGDHELVFSFFVFLTVLMGGETFECLGPVQLLPRVLPDYAHMWENEKKANR